MTNAVEIHNDFENELTPLEEIILFSLVFDREKAIRRKRYVQQGMNRRQDHGARGWHQGHVWDDRERDFSDAAKRRDFRAAGRQITGTMYPYKRASH